METLMVLSRFADKEDKGHGATRRGTAGVRNSVQGP